MKLKNDINDIKFCHQIIINEVWSNNDYQFLSLTTSRRSHNRISLIFKSTTKQIEIWNNDIRDKHMYGEMKTLHMFTRRLEELKTQLRTKYESNTPTLQVEWHGNSTVSDEQNNWIK